MLAGTVTLGLVVSPTVTLKLAVAVLPAASVAVQVTVVVPSANVDPLGGLQVGMIDPFTTSVALLMA